MKFSAEAAVLRNGLNHVRRVAERKSTIPILSNLLLYAEDGKVALKASNLDLEISLGLPAEVHAPGAITVPAQLMYDIVAKSQEGSTVVAEVDDNTKKLIVRSGRSRFQLHTLPVEDFPTMQLDAKTNCRFNMPATNLRRVFSQAEFAISTEETRYYLNGIFFHTTGNGKNKVLRGVATDGHRLAMADTDLPEGAEAMSGHSGGNAAGVLVPRFTVAEILKLVDKCSKDDQVAFACDGGKIEVHVGDIKLVSKLIDGTFPDYGRVVPTGNEKIALLDRQWFRDAIDRVTTISSERGRAVRLDFANDSVKLTVSNPDSGDAADEGEIEYKHDPLTIGFNSRYLLDILGHIDAEIVELQLADAGSPMLVKARGVGREQFVLMPMRV